MTTRAVRAREEAIEGRFARLAGPAARDAGEVARRTALDEVAERIGTHLSAEQRHAVELVTGTERAAVVIGPAGTGKGSSD